MEKIGILGGTFDPVHKGHLQLADAALQEVDLDKVLFIPSAYPPHKNMAKVASFEHRFKMLEIGVSNKEQFVVSDLESKREKPSYTFETLRELKEPCSEDLEYYFIIGCDAFIDIKSWYRWKEVISSTNFILAIRPGFDELTIINYMECHGFVAKDDEDGVWAKKKYDNKVLLLKTAIDDISSTAVRKNIYEERKWTDLIPDDVAEYIVSHSLYV